MPDWTVTDVILDDDGAYQITAHPDTPPVYCNKCDRQSNLTPIETKQLKYIDAPVHGRSCFVLATRTRYKCAACGGEFWEGLAGVDTRRFKTLRCVRYIQRQSLLKPNTHVAEEVGVSETVVRLIAKPHADYLNECHRKELRAPRFLGMDETKLAGSMRAVFIDLEDGWPIELLANHRDLTIKNFLMNLPGRNDVEVVTMDMCERYRDIVNAVMPQAAVVVVRAELRRVGLLDIVEQLERSRPRNTSCDERVSQNIAAAFLLSQQFVSAADQCLVRGIAMKRLLAQRGCDARLVFGVRMPFSAHCWVQAEDVVLTDTLDIIRRYQPIFAV